MTVTGTEIVSLSKYLQKDRVLVVPPNFLENRADVSIGLIDGKL